MAQGGDDTITTTKGIPLFAYGGDGADSIAGGDRRDGIIGGLGDDQLRGLASADFLDGSEGDDSLFGGAGPDLLLGGAGGDRGEGGPGPDRLSLGSGDDVGLGGDHDDRLYGGPGADTLSGGNGGDLLRGGPGDDTLNGNNGPDALAGGLGDDILVGGPGDDILHGGPGVDQIDGGDGNDTIRIASPCEVRSGETIDGGPGQDVLVTHLTAAELEALGVRVFGIEKVVVLDSNPSRDICEYESTDDGYVEAIVRVEQETTFWRTSSGDFKLDGHVRSKSGAGLMRHYFLRVEDLVSSDGTSVVEGDEIRLLREGGMASFLDGTSVAAFACCNPGPIVGGRYRVALRWDRERSEFRYLTDPFGAAGEVPLVQLPEFGTLPFVPDFSEFQAPASMCPNAPEPRSFQSVGDTVRWTTRIPTDPVQTSVRWRQNQSFAPTWVGNFASPQLTFHESANRLCGDYYDYDHFLRDGIQSWYRRGSVGTQHGVMLPGTAPFNSISYSTCNAGDHDSVNCVAVQGEHEDNGDIQVHITEGSSKWTPDTLALTERWVVSLDAATWVPELTSADWLGLSMVTEADILFRNFGDSAWSDCIDGPANEEGEGLEFTATHEVGHFMGLGHNDCPFELMFGRRLVDGVTDADWARIRILYPGANSGCEFPENIYVDEEALPAGACGTP